MTLNNATAERPQTGSSGPPQTAQECQQRIVRVVDEVAALMVRRNVLAERLQAFDMDFAVADDPQYDRLEAELAEVEARIERGKRRHAVLADMMDTLEKQDRRAEANRHRAEAQALELQARPLRRSLRDGLLQVLEAVQRLDALKVRHAGHASSYSGILEKLAKEENPHYYRAVELPVGTNMRDHRQALEALLKALTTDRPGQQDAERLADQLDRLMLPYDLPPVEEEED